MARFVFMGGFWLIYAGILFNIFSWRTSAHSNYELTGEVLILTGLWVSGSGFLWWALNNG